jgi:phosphate transport system substrate-binding protein
VAGNVVVDGSTAFAPSVAAVAARLRAQCSDSVVTVNPPGSGIGSRAGAAGLQDSGGSAGATNLVMSDGLVIRADYPNLVPHAVAIVIFSVVVNRATGVTSLTEIQLRDIWRGEYTNWRQLGGANLPIDLIARSADSGTRATFDSEILGASELPASSENCTSRNPGQSSSPVIRCEKSSTTQVLQAVNELPGAIGYAEYAQAAQYQHIDQVQLDGVDASPSSVRRTPEYPFWAVEYLYTYDNPPPGSLLATFLRYMYTDTAKSIMQAPDYGDIPCSLTTLCG